MTPNRIFFLSLFFLVNSFCLAQFKVIQLSSGFEQNSDSLFWGTSQTRSIKSLNSNWKIFFAEEPENFNEVSFPSIFKSKKPVIFEKEFTLTPEELTNNYISLTFLGINYTAEIFINNAGVYKHPGGEIPFTIDLPSDILNYDIPNTIRIKVDYQLDSENTIPLLQRFLFPKNFGGILRDVYLSFRPKVGIKNIDYNISKERRPYVGRFNFQVHLEDFAKIVADSLLPNFDGRFKIEALLKKTSDTSKVYFNIWNIRPNKNPPYSKEFSVRLRKFAHWNSKSPVSYVLSVRLTNGDGFIYDEMYKEITLLELAKKNKEIQINDVPFEIKGVTYIRSLDENYNYEKIENDIKLIKQIGFNTIRFSKTFPHPYAVYLAQKYGLLSLIELPLNSVPENLTEDNNFEQRVESFLKRSIGYYNNFPNVIGYSVGGSFLSTSDLHNDFLSKMNLFIKNISENRLTYSSFIGLPNSKQINTDLYGIEIYSGNLEKLNEYFSNTRSDSLLYFISEATYPTYKGTSNGYLNNHSFEGQAKFFDDVISITENQKLNGFVLNSMFDYSGDFSPFFSGFNNDNLYHIGINSQADNESKISYNLIKSKLTKGTNIAIPIGSNSEDAPLFFIIAALAISIIIALLINSKRKFREDATRALLRPYNFYADVRDQRILSGFHSNTLMFLLAGSNALLLTILLFYLKDSFLVDKIVIAFGNYQLSKIAGDFAWNPEKAFIYIYIATIIGFVTISFLVHLSSFFVKTKVLFSSVYSVLIWAFLPLALILPLEAILYKVLLLQSYNLIIAIVIIISIVWMIQRFLKGIYVIFDVRPLFVYSYAFLTLIIILAGIGFYFQYKVSAFDYINLAIKQYMNL